MKRITSTNCVSKASCTSSIEDVVCLTCVMVSMIGIVIPCVILVGLGYCWQKSQQRQQREQHEQFRQQQQQQNITMVHPQQMFQVQQLQPPLQFQPQQQQVIYQNQQEQQQFQPQPIRVQQQFQPTVPPVPIVVVGTLQ